MHVLGASAIGKLTKKLRVTCNVPCNCTQREAIYALHVLHYYNLDRKK